MTASAAEISRWIRDVHASLAPSATLRTAAAWGPVTVRHRTTRPAWFGGFDSSWAAPIAPPTSADVDVDVITASLDDLPYDAKPPKIDRSMLGVRGEVRSLDGTPTRMVWIELGGEITAWDPDSSAAVIIRSREPEWFDRVSPMRWLLHWSVVGAGGVVLHAACVGRRSGGRTAGVLLLGEAGYGKSTTTLGCLNDGWVTCGDDAVAVFREHNRWHARAIYATMKTKLAGNSPASGDSTGIKSPAAVTWDVEGGKRVHLLSTTRQPSIEPRIDIDALILLAPHDPPGARYTSVTGALARTRIAPSTVMPLPFDRQIVLERIGELVSDVPAFSLPRRASVAKSVVDVANIAEQAQRMNTTSPAPRAAC